MSTPQKIDSLHNYANVIQAALNMISTINHPKKKERVPGAGHTEPPLLQEACKYTENDLFSERGRKRHQAGDRANEDKHISACPMHHSIPGSVGHNFRVAKSRPSHPVCHDRHLFEQGGNLVRPTKSRRSQQPRGQFPWEKRWGVYRTINIILQ